MSDVKAGPRGGLAESSATEAISRAPADAKSGKAGPFTYTRDIHLVSKVLNCQKAGQRSLQQSPYSICTRTDSAASPFNYNTV